MNAIKRILLGLLIIAIIVGIGLALFNNLQERRMMKMLRDGQVTIDQEIHDWRICNDNSPVKIDMFVRNSGQYQIAGTLVISGTLSKKGLEKKFLREFIDCYGEERLKKEITEEIAKKGSNGWLAAVYNYLLRGSQLAPGQDYEPIESKAEDTDYTFKFRKQIRIRPGEILKTEHEEQLPFNVRGHLLKVKIENIEF